MTTELLKILAIISLALVGHAVAWFVYYKLSRRIDAQQEKLDNNSDAVYTCMREVFKQPNSKLNYDKFVKSLPESPLKASLFKTNGET